MLIAAGSEIFEVRAYFFSKAYLPFCRATAIIASLKLILDGLLIIITWG